MCENSLPGLVALNDVPEYRRERYVESVNETAAALRRTVDEFVAAALDPETIAHHSRIYAAGRAIAALHRGVGFACVADIVTTAAAADRA